MTDSGKELRTSLAKGVDGLTPELLTQLPPPIKHRRQRGDNAEADEAAQYRIAQPLLKAVQVALVLRQPLLLMGEPGVGKTTFANALAHRLGLPLAKRITVKSTTSGRDLLYTFDDMRQFRSAAAGTIRLDEKRNAPPADFDPARKRAEPIRNFVTLNPLGLGIVRAAGSNYIVRPTKPLADIAGPQFASREDITLGELFPQAFGQIGAADGLHTVVLIDEIDKAPRDAPNDLLDEIERMQFGIDELGIEAIKAKPQLWPIVIITSNSERNLPPAFLRRCVFHNLELADSELPHIVVSWLEGSGLKPGSKLVTGLIQQIFLEIRKQPGLDKKPSIGELIAAALVLHDYGLEKDKEPWLQGEWQHVKGSLVRALAKTKQDSQRIETILDGLSGSGKSR